MKHTGAGLNHLEACYLCPKYVTLRMGARVSMTGCSAYGDTSWVNRRGGCGMFPERDMPPAFARMGQQKQKHKDRKYEGKNDRRGKYRA
jgi:hypothetical protein